MTWYAVAWYDRDDDSPPPTMAEVIQISEVTSARTLDHYEDFVTCEVMLEGEVHWKLMGVGGEWQFRAGDVVITVDAGQSIPRHWKEENQ